MARELLPQIENLIRSLRGIQLTLKEVAEGSPCEACSKVACDKPCEHLEALLSRPCAGKLHGQTTIGVNLDEIMAQGGGSGQGSSDKDVKKADRGTFRGFRAAEPFDPLEPYKSCWHRLSPEQRQVVLLHYGEGKNVGVIAETLHRSPSSVSGRLKRAKEVKEEYMVEMRRKEFLFQRELEAKADEI